MIKLNKVQLVRVLALSIMASGIGCIRSGTVTEVVGGEECAVCKDTWETDLSTCWNTVMVCLKDSPFADDMVVCFDKLQLCMREAANNGNACSIPCGDREQFDFLSCESTCNIDFAGCEAESLNTLIDCANQCQTTSCQDECDGANKQAGSVCVSTSLQCNHACLN